MKTRFAVRTSPMLICLWASLLVCGCSKSKDGIPPSAKTPEQAASGLEQTFADAPPVVKQDVSAVSEALRKRDYEKAVVTLSSVQKAPGITLQQGMAIQDSSVLLERELINGIERGDPRAKAAYELLKRSRRN